MAFEFGQKHLQGSDVWFRKVFFDEPMAEMDVNQDGAVNWQDGREKEFIKNKRSSLRKRWTAR